MPDESLVRIEEAFHEAQALPPAARADFVRARFADDRAAAEEVLSLLGAVPDTTAFIEPPAGGAAAILGEASAARLVGQRVGSFTCTRLIGSGGMGAVYEAEQEQPHRKVAIKVMRAGLASKQALKRFEYEAEILARLRHPGIAQVYEAGTFDDGGGPVPYFAMELVPEARDLLDYAEEKMLDLKERLALFTSLCEAVHHGHQKGVIHRDLKPANILVDSSGRLKIIDFGVARATDADVNLTTMQTHTGQIIGTAQYMSPEQWRADPTDLDTRSDVYALGMILYELLCGATAFDLERAALHEVARIVLEDTPRRPGTLDTTLRGDLETIILKAIEKDRRRRYASASDLAQDVTRYLTHQPIEARPPSLTYQLRMFARRNRAVCTAIGLIFLVLLGAAIVSAVFAVRARRAERESDVQARAEADARAHADRLFAEGRSFAGWTIFEFIDGLEALPGATRAEEQLARRVLAYLDGLAEEKSTDPTLRREIAAAYHRIGGVLGDPSRHNLGRTGEALAAYRKALAIHDALLATDHAATEDTAGRARALARIGVLTGLLGQRAEGRRDLEEASRLFAALEAKVDDPRPFARDRITCRAEIGSLWKEDGRLDDAAREFATGLAAAEAQAAAHPDDTRCRRDLAAAHSRIGALEETRSNLAAAETHFRRALELTEAIRADHPHDAEVQRALSSAFIAMGDLHLQQGGHDTALATYERALKIREASVAANPDSAAAAADLAVAHERMANAHQIRREIPAALVEARRGLKVTARLRAIDPANVYLRRSEWILRLKIAGLTLEAGPIDEARPEIEAALNAARELVKEMPESVTDRQGVAEAHDLMGNYWIRRPGEKASKKEMLAAMRAAHLAYSAGVEIVEEIGERTPLTPAQKNLAAAFRKKMTLVTGAIRQIEAPNEE